MTSKPQLPSKRVNVAVNAGGAASARRRSRGWLIASAAAAFGLSVLHVQSVVESAVMHLSLCLGCFALLAKCGSRGLTDFAIRGLIITLPISFRSILGTGYEEMPVSWFNLFEMLFVLCAFFRPVAVEQRCCKIWPPIVFCFLVAYLPAVALGNDAASAFRQYLHFLAFGGLVLSAAQVQDLFARNEGDAYVRLYVMSVEVTAFTLLCQIAASRLWGVTLGTQITMGGQREAFGSSFTDFSYLSIFLATGAAMRYAAACAGARGTVFLLGEVVALLMGSILTTARSGLVAFALGVIAWHVLRIGKVRTRQGARTAALVVTAASCVALVSVLGGLREDLLDDSGRREGYQIALRAFQSTPWFGVGLGVTAYRETVGQAIPHNSAIQYLVQGGLIGFSAFLLLGIALLRASVSSPAPILAAYLVALVGSLFVPDLINSRFFPVLSIFALASGQEARWIAPTMRMTGSRERVPSPRQGGVVC